MDVDVGKRDGGVAEGTEEARKKERKKERKKGRRNEIHSSSFVDIVAPARRCLVRRWARR